MWSFTCTCWRCWSYWGYHAVCAQEGPDMPKSWWRGVQMWKAFCSLPSPGTQLLGEWGTQQPPTPPQDAELEKPSSLRECGLFAPVTSIEVNDAILKSVFWDQCGHSFQRNILQGTCARLSPWGKRIGRGEPAALSVRDELQGFAVRGWRWETGHLNAPGEIEKS